MVAAVAQLLDHGADPREVGVAGAGRRRVDADEEQPGRVEQLAHLGREGEPLGVALEQLSEARLVDRHLAAGERLDLLGDDVARDHRVAELGEAGGGDQADPSDPDHADRLSVSPSSLRPPRFGFALGISTLAERAMPTIWSLVSVFSRSLETQ